MEYMDLLNDAYSKVELHLGDSGERFSVPKVSGHHLGNKTVISNFLAIAGHVRRDPLHMIKFLNKELATASEMQNDRLLIGRKVSSGDVNDRIDKYVSSFVLCSKCKKPDTELVDEGGKTVMRCLACGERRSVHKL